LEAVSEAYAVDGRDTEEAVPYVVDELVLEFELRRLHAVTVRYVS
jgi:hypothetical protein